MQQGRAGLLAALVLMVGTVALGTESVENRAVERRMALMQRSDIALDTLSGMMTGRLLFNQDAAKQARRELIEATGDIAKRFRRARTDTLSHADPRIWENWSDFEARAKAANKAAKSIRTRSPSRLSDTVPALIGTCLNCHQIYRKPNDELGRTKSGRRFRLN